MTDAIRSTIQKRDSKGRIRHGGEWLAIWADPDSVKTQDELKEEIAANERLSKVKRSLTATARSIARRPRLAVRFQGTRAHIEGTTAVLPELPKDLTMQRLSAVQGEADALSCFLRYHDPKIHNLFRPTKPHPAALFDICERTRCEVLGVQLMPGIWRHLIDAQNDRLDSLGLLFAHIAAQIPIVEALPSILRDFLLGRQHLSVDSGAMEMWDRFIRSRQTSNMLALRDALNDQKSYARQALNLIDGIYDALEHKKEELTRPGHKRPNAAPRSDNAILFDENESKENHKPIVSKSETHLETDDPEYVSTQMFDLPTDHAEPVLDEITAKAEREERPYRVFSRTHDQVRTPLEVLSGDRLIEHRQAIDETMSAQRKHLVRLANRLARRLLAQQRRDWLFDLEEGLLDTSRLDRVIVNPGSALSFKLETDTAFRDTIVTLLIDNSGSMRGEPIMTAALTAELVAGALERAGIKCEVLGYTTVDWNGGKVFNDWLKAGKPKDPGRLSDLLHVIYKGADVPLRRARNNMALMLEPGLLKENIDGEAIEWAERRLSSRQELRKILIVISDGAPVDHTTLENNTDPDLLDRHLRNVIARIEDSTDIEIIGIGLKHDVTSYYKNSFVIQRHADLGETLIAELDRLFDN